MNETNGHGESDPIKEALRPLVGLLDEVKHQRAEIKGTLDAKDEEIRRLEKLLRPEGLLPEAPRTKARPTTYYVSTEMRAKIEAAISTLPDEPFTVREAGEAADVNESSVRGALDLLHREGVLRIVGNRPAKHPPHRDAVHYQVAS